MDSPHTNPRRRSSYNSRASATSNQPTSPLNVSTGPGPYYFSLRKSSTFSSPTSPSGEDDPILHIPSLPRRSPTSTEDLQALASGDDRISQIIGAVDRSLSGLQIYSQDSLGAEDHPVPLFFHSGASQADRMDMDQSQNSSHSSATHRPAQHKKHHSSDSGIGSTISDSDTAMSVHHAGMKQGAVNKNKTTSKNMSPPMTEGRVHTGINGLTALATGSTSGSQHVLSEHACRQIQKHIIVPIVSEPKLKDFHSLVKGIPFRVGRKEITCLRDLEKVLLWLAPKWSTTKSSFLYFCETSIQCIRTTVDYLNEQDQRRPTDRPYTNGYFLDLVEQVRQYATMLQASRARAGSENHADEDQSSSDHKIELVGGLSQTGRVAELVRTTSDGRSISLRTGEEMSPEQMAARYQHGVKRSVSEESDEEDVLRSMARRRKSAQAAVKDAQKCSECSKVFKRPCDLTKHEKTHSRPWKCSDSTCKYHEYGWPTEKERDRHANDKHSATPSMYKCQYTPCPYESKRESNCKQHMEKAHGWQYIRSKNNGKNNKKPQNGVTPPTPSMSTPNSLDFNAPTPDFSENQSYYQSPPTRPMEHNPSNELFGPFEPASTPFTEMFGPFNPTEWSDMNAFRPGNSTEYTENSHRPSWDTTMTDPSAPTSAFEPPMDYDEQLFNGDFDWSNMNNDSTSFNLQLHTPATSVEMGPFDAYSRNPSVPRDERRGGHAPSLSPGAQADTMFYTPYSMPSNDIAADEGYAETHNRPDHDFPLFGNSNTSSLNNTADGSMFPDLSTFTNWPGTESDMGHHYDMSM